MNFINLHVFGNSFLEKFLVRPNKHTPIKKYTYKFIRPIQKIGLVRKRKQKGDRTQWHFLSSFTSVFSKLWWMRKRRRPTSPNFSFHNSDIFEPLSSLSPRPSFLLFFSSSCDVTKKVSLFIFCWAILVLVIWFYCLYGWI